MTQSNAPVAPGHPGVTQNRELRVLPQEAVGSRKGCDFKSHPAEGDASWVFVKSGHWVPVSLLV